MPLTLYGSPIATCTQRVIMLCKELDVPYELVALDLLKGEHKAPGHLAVQPFGKVPVLRDDEEDLCLFESRCIMRYVAAKYWHKMDLIGVDIKPGAFIDNWLEAEGHNYDPPVASIVREKVFGPSLFGRTPDEAVVSDGLRRLETVLDAYETVLSDGRTYIAGDQFSVADISHVPYTWLLVHAAGVTEPLRSRPNVWAWWQRISTRQSWLDTLAECSPAQAAPK